MTSAPVILLPSEGESIRIFGGIDFIVKVSSEQTGGAFTLLYNLNPSGTFLPPHVHGREDETFYILQGQYEFTIEGQLLSAGPGATVFAPRGIPHSYKVVSDDPGIALVLATPGGFEKCVKEMSMLALDPPDMPAVLETCSRYGIDFLPPPGA